MITETKKSTSEKMSHQRISNLSGTFLLISNIFKNKASKVNKQPTGELKIRQTMTILIVSGYTVFYNMASRVSTFPEHLKFLKVRQSH